MAECSQISDETNENENTHKHQEIHLEDAESMNPDDESNSHTEMKKPMSPEQEVEDAIIGNYMLGKPRGKVPESKKTQENLHDISLWGVPLLPSKGHEGTDIILLKFLKARDFKVSEAFNMLRRTLIWRREFKTEGILEENFGPELENVVYINSTDKEGHPLCYNVCGAFKDRDFYKKTFGSEAKCEEFLRWRVQSMEKVIQNLNFTAGGVDSMVQILDLKNSPRPSNKELRLVTKKAITLLQDNYPELIFRHPYANFQFISQRTKSKFILARPSGVADTLLKFIAPENLPVQYGGLKRENDIEFSPADKALELIVKAGTIESIEIPATEAGVTVVWDMTIVGWDVNYKEEFIPEDEGSYKILLEKYKKMGQSMRNSFYISEPGKIVITIENGTYKRKRVLYRFRSKPTVPMYVYFK
ncbi:Patellin-4 [Vitis vinifera]|uniref:Patellin-4 n=1 Tax=Vitis vinifera TaxID=29760 RepID=A0A438KCZ4_VITVI|nr:Patellin-4 [Vitis vinifera]